jgi:hypothetical protein
MQVGGPEGFIHIDIAQAGDTALIEQEGFQSAFEAGEPFAENREGKGAKERLGAEVGQVGLGIRDDQPAPELAGVAVAQAAAVIKRENDAVMGGGRGIRGCPVELAGHAEMNEQIGAAGKMQNDELSPAFDRGDGLILEPGDKLGRSERGDGTMPEDLDFAEGAATNAGPAQIAHNRFDFGQFGHQVSFLEDRIQNSEGRPRENAPPVRS